MQTRRTIPFLRAVLILGALAVSTAAQTTPKLDGVDNFRDIGGYKTADGHSIRPKLVYRSGQLSATTPGDQTKLAALGIRYEIDLRMEGERTQQPSHWGPNPPKLITAFHYAPEERMAGLGVNYGQIPLDHATDLGQIMREVAQADSPVLIHCSAGKDRTGMTIAVLMTLAGVPRPEVYREFLRSNDDLDRRLELGRAQRKAANQPEPTNACLAPMPRCVEAGWLDAFFKAIDLKYKSFDAYSRDALKLTPADVARLRSRLLEK